MRQMFMKVDNHRETIDKIDATQGWFKFSIENLNKITEDVPMMAKVQKDTEEYLHRILPIKTQIEIYKSTAQAVPKTEAERRLDFLQFTKDELLYL